MSTIQTKIKEKDDTIKSAKKLYFIREEIIKAFKKGIFPQKDGFQVEKGTDEESTLEGEKIDTTDMPELESEEFAEQRINQQGKGLKLLTPNQMPSRLPIFQLN